MAMQGRVDGMEGGCVIGWAVVPPSGRCAISITDPEGRPVAQGHSGAPREDLAALGLGRTDFAFKIAVPGWPVSQELHVLADGQALPGSPVRLGPGRYDGDCRLEGARLTGWVRERLPEMRAPSIAVVTQHGEVVGEADCEWDAEADRATFALALGDACFGAGELRLSLLADGVWFAERGCALAVEGHLDRITPERCSGWLLAPDAPDRRFEIEIRRDGVVVAVAVCGSARPDVEAMFSSRDAGFSASYPAGSQAEISLRLRGSAVELFGGPYLVASRPAAILAAQGAARWVHSEAALAPGERAVLRLALKQFMAQARAEDDALASRSLPAMPGDRGLAIVIPVYGGIEATRICIDSVLATRQAGHRVILVNDASPEPGMDALLARYTGEPNLFLLVNAVNQGFIKAVNRGIGFAGASDVLLLNADTRVFPGGFAALHALAKSAPDIATVTALSNNATIFSYPGPELQRATLPDIGWAALAGIALRDNAGLGVEVPTGHGFCLLVTAAALRDCGGFDESLGRGYGEENDFCARAADLGYRHLAAAAVFVEHAGSLSFHAEKQPLLARNLSRLMTRYPEYFPQLAAFERAEGLRAARWALDAARLARASSSAFVLVIGNRLGGGSAKAMAEIEAAIPGPCLMLTCLEDGMLELAAETPLLRACFAPDEIDPLFRLLAAAAPRRVSVHQLLGFPQAFLRRLAVWIGTREAVFHLHDFYPLCPRVTGIDAADRFCGFAPVATCGRCLVAGAHEQSRLGLDAAAHRALFAELLGGFTRVIAPSESAAAHLRAGMPGVTVVALAHPQAPAPMAPRPAQDDAEIVLFGALGPHKGARQLLELARRARIDRPALSFRVIGYTSLDDELLACGNVFITGRYTPEQLPALVARARGRLALFLHQWPETYSYTLSEALRFGFLPLVPEIGAPAERLRALGRGIVFAFPFDAAQVLEVIDAAIATALPPAGALPLPAGAGLHRPAEPGFDP